MIARLATIAALALGTPAFGQTADVVNFYKGRQVFLQAGSGPGEGYDLYARLVARFIAKHIPGQPSIAVQNVPGGGSLTLANQFGNVTPRDGSVFGIFNNGMPTTPLLNPGVAKFDPRKFGFLGSPNREVQVFIAWHASPVKTINDLFTKEVIVGASAPGAATFDFPLLTNVLLGTKLKIISGYPGTAAQQLAMERGELHANPAVAWVSAKTQHGTQIAEKKLLVIGQYGFRAHPDIPQVPLFPTGETEEARQMFRLLYARQDFGRPFLTPPEVPAERLAALRAAMDATMRDPEFLAEAARQKLDIEPLRGTDLQDLTEKLFQTPLSVLDRMRSLLGTKSTK